jgi:hypothetical protein
VTTTAGVQRPPRVVDLVIVPIALVVHNAEEWLTIGRALPQVESALSGYLGRPVMLPSVDMYHMALVALTALAIAAYGMALRWPSTAYVLVVLQAVMALNVIVHVVVTLAIAGYAPGVVSAILVEGPVSWLLYGRLRREAWMTANQWRWLLPLALIVHASLPVALLAFPGT